MSIPLSDVRLSVKCVFKKYRSIVDMGDFGFIFGEGEPSYREKILHQRDYFIFQCFVRGSSDHKVVRISDEVYFLSVPSGEALF